MLSKVILNVFTARLLQVLKIFAKKLFPGYRVMSVHAFRITRNSDLYIDDEEVDDGGEYVRVRLRACFVKKEPVEAEENNNK